MAGRCSILVTQYHGRKHGVLKFKGEIMAGDGGGVGAGRCPVLVAQHHGRKHGVHKGEIMGGAYKGVPGGSGW